MFKNIRLIVSVVTITVLLLTFVLSLLVSREQALDATFETIKIRLISKLNFIQGASEQFIEFGKSERVNQLLSSFYSDPDILLMVMIDSEGKVIASSRYEYVSKTLSEIKGKYGVEKLEKAVISSEPLIVFDENNFVADGYISICAKDDNFLIKNEKCGALLISLDLLYHRNITDSFLFQEAIILSGGAILAIIFVLVMLEFVITRPAMNIISAVRKFNAGDRAARISVRGENDITRVSNTINQLLDKVVNDENELINKEERLQAIIETTMDAIITINQEGIIQSTNRAISEQLGYSDNELVGENISKIMPEPYKSKHDSYLKEYLKNGVRHAIGKRREVTAVSKDGIDVPVEISVSEIKINRKVFYIGVLRDISDRMQFTEAMKQISNELFTANLELKNKVREDPLTGIANRKHLNDVLSSEVRRSVRNSRYMSFMMLDIDYFKKYNDHYGHQQGDECLKAVASKINDIFNRSGELVARYGGEEFSVILPDCDSELACKLAEDLREAILELNIPHEKSEIEESVTISIGVTTLKSESNLMISENEIIESADKALYQAKDKGRNAVHCVTIKN